MFLGEPRFTTPELSSVIAEEAQFTLLSAIAHDRLRDAARHRLAELQREYGADMPAEPRGAFATFIGSPISDEDARALDDEGWIATVARLPDDRRDPDRPLEGRATQLAQQMQQLAEEDPNRFARMATQLPDGTNPIYFEHVLIALGQTRRELDRDAVVRFCLRCHELPGRPVGRWIAWPIARLADGPLPDEVIESVAWYATEDPNPDPATETSDDYGMDPSIRGINTARGAAARWLATIIVKDPQRLHPLVPAVERVARDASIAVRASAADLLTAALARQPRWAIRTFQELIDTDDVVLAARTVERFVAVAADHDLEAMVSIVERMLNSPLDAVRGAGARRAALFALEYSAARSLVDEVLHGDDVVRKNGAGVFAHNLATAGYREACEECLVRLFDDDDGEVRKQAADCFRVLPDDLLGDHDELVRTFLRSRAFADGADKLLLACEVVPTPLPDLTLAVCRAWLERVDEIVEQSDGPLGGDALTVAELAVRAYTQAQDVERQNAALDVFDGLIARQAYGVDRALSIAEADR